MKKHLLSYVYAFRGIVAAFRLELNMKLHFLAAIAVIAVNYILNINKTEWIVTIVLISIVWMAEIFNTAMEKLADRVTKEQDVMIGQVKDLAAGAVLIVCIAAVVCAAMIYVPYLT